MATPRPSLLFVVALHLLLLAAAVEAAGAGAGATLPVGWISSLSSCRGSIAECLAGDELAFGSEVTRRLLGTSSYISYGALKRDTTPCSRRGASYYNCRPGAQANPYSRSCSSITQCRG